MRGVVSIARSDCRDYITMTFTDRKTGESWIKRIPAAEVDRVRDLKRRFFQWVESRE